LPELFDNVRLHACSIVYLYLLHNLVQDINFVLNRLEQELAWSKNMQPQNSTSNKEISKDIVMYVVR